jgi:hypothetical protein
MHKPTAIMYGLCQETLLFMDIPKAPYVRMRNDNGKTGRIRVTGGSMKMPQIVKELDWLVPGDHQWDIYPYGNNMFQSDILNKGGCG